MSTIKILRPPSSLLRQTTQDLVRSELRKKELQNHIDEALNFVYASNNKGASRANEKPSTAGLSFIQFGIPFSISIVDLGIGHKTFGDVHVLINPKITWISKTVQSRTEGCINFPNIWGKVPRSLRVKISSLDRSGNILQLDLKGWPAVLLQHEIDHNHGILFIDRLKDPKKAHMVQDTEYKQYKKLHDKWNKYADMTKFAKGVKLKHKLNIYSCLV